MNILELRLKVSFFQKDPWFLPKHERTNSVFFASRNAVWVQKTNSFVRFLGEFEDTKSPFEIIWPLDGRKSFMYWQQNSSWKKNIWPTFQKETFRLPNFIKITLRFPFNFNYTFQRPHGRNVIHRVLKWVPRTVAKAINHTPKM